MDPDHNDVTHHVPRDEEPSAKRPRLSNEVDASNTPSSPCDTPVNLRSDNVTKDQDDNKAMPCSSVPAASMPSSDDPRVPIPSLNTRTQPEYDNEELVRKSKKIRNISILDPAYEICTYLSLPNSSDPWRFLAWNPQMKGYMELPNNAVPRYLLSWTLKPDSRRVSGNEFWDTTDYRPSGEEGLDTVRGMDRLRWFFRRLMLFDMYQWFASCGVKIDVEWAMVAVLPPENCAFPEKGISRRCAEGRNLAELCERFGHGCLFLLQEGLAQDFLDDLLYKTENYDASIAYLETLQLGRNSTNLVVEQLSRDIRTVLLDQHRKSMAYVKVMGLQKR